MNKIAFLYLTIDNLKQNKIWELFFKDVDTKLYNIYVHPKNAKKVTDPLLKDNIIDKVVPTKHGFLVEAMVALLESAIKDKDNKYFIFVSDSCIPIKKFDHIYKEIFSIDKTIVGKMFLKKWNKEKRYSLAKKKVANNESVPISCLVKFSQWSVLKLSDALKIISSKYLPLFYAMDAGDEFYLSILECEGGFIYDDLPATYVDWKISDEFASSVRKIKKELEQSLKKYNYGVKEADRIVLKDIIGKLKMESSSLASHPREFEKISKNDIKLLKSTKAFFARKFSKDSDIGGVIDQIW